MSVCLFGCLDVLYSVLFRLCSALEAYTNSSASTFENPCRSNPASRRLPHTARMTSIVTADILGYEKVPKGYVLFTIQVVILLFV